MDPLVCEDWIGDNKYCCRQGRDGCVNDCNGKDRINLYYYCCSCCPCMPCSHCYPKDMTPEEIAAWKVEFGVRDL